MMRSILTVARLLLLAAAAACDRSPSRADPEPQPSPRDTALTFAIDSTGLRLVSDSAAYAAGSLRFVVSGTTPPLIAGDVLVGQQGGGFLARVASTSRAGDTLIVATAEAALADAIREGEVQIATQLRLGNGTAAAADALVEGPRVELGPVRVTGVSRGISFTPQGVVISDLELFASSDGSLRLSVPQGVLRFEPGLDVRARVAGVRLREMRMVATGELSASMDLRMRAQAAASTRGEKTLWTYRQSFTAYVPVGPALIPVVGEAAVKVIGAYEAEAEAAVTAQGGFTAGGTIAVGATFANGQWTAVRDAAPSFEGHPVAWDIEANVSGRLSIKPVLSVTFYRLAGPYLQAEAWARLTGTARASDGSWKRELTAGIDGAFGGRIQLLDRTLTQAELPWTGPSRVVFADSGRVAGALSGRVVSAVTFQPLSGASVTATRGGVNVTSIASGSDGGWSIPALGVGTYSLRVERTGYVTVPVAGVTVVRDRTTTVEPVPLVPASSSPGAVAGTIRNVRSYAGLPGAVLEIRAGMNAVDGPALASTSSDGSGNYRFAGLAAGTYTVSARLAGYAAGGRTGIVVGAQEVRGQDVLLSPDGAAAELRIVLQWGASPSDLDSHLTGPVQGGGRFHVYWFSRGLLTASPWAGLDRDDISSYGPETITLVRQLAGVYRYTVHNYTVGSSTTSTSLAASGAQVDVYRGNTLLDRFFVPNLPGTLWTVFDLDGDRIIPINTVGAGYAYNPPTAAAAAAAGPPPVKAP